MNDDGVGPMGDEFHSVFYPQYYASIEMVALEYAEHSRSNQME